MDRPKVGLALSGGSGRAIAHAGVLDVLAENNIPIDYIAACSSGAIVAAAYSCGTLPELKSYVFNELERKDLLGLIRPSGRGGILALKNIEAQLQPYTRGLNMEDVRPQLAFTSIDLNTGELVPITLGGIGRGIKAACSVPFIFEPVMWGGKTLVDAGLVNVVPSDVVKQMGADIVITVDIAATRMIFTRNHLQLMKGFLWMTKSGSSPFLYTKRLFNQLYSQSDMSDMINIEESMPSFAEVFTRILEIAAKREQLVTNFKELSDVLIEPKVKHHGRLDIRGARLAYNEGRVATIKALPRLKRLIFSDNENLKHASKMKEYGYQQT